MSKSPASVVKEKFGDKAKLVAALQPFAQEDMWVDRLNAKKGLSRVSSAKLLHLHRILSEVKARFGTRFKLIDEICNLEKRTKDNGYRKRLLGYPVPRLYDVYRSVCRAKGIVRGTRGNAEPRAGSGTVQEASSSGARAAGGEAAASAKAPDERVGGRSASTGAGAKGAQAKAAAEKSKAKKA